MISQLLMLKEAVIMGKAADLKNLDQICSKSQDDVWFQHFNDL